MKTRQSYIISQSWKNLFFLNFRVDKDLLGALLPTYLEPDLYNGESYTSVVPFQMTNIRFPITPVLPFSNLTELNLRTYVKYNDIPGIYYFTLDSNHMFGNWIARNFFDLPYRFSKIDSSYEKKTYSYSCDLFELQATVGEELIKDELEKFLVERYSLFTDDGKSIYQGKVFHKPWRLNKVDDFRFVEKLNSKYQLNNVKFESCFFSKELDVYFKPFKRIGKL